MRFKDVLTFDKTNLSISFNFKNLCKMRNFTADDVSHIGKVINYCALGSQNIVNYKVPLTDLNLQVNTKTGNVDVSKDKDNDFAIGMCIVVPISMMIGIILYRIPTEMYFALGIIGYFMILKN